LQAWRSRKPTLARKPGGGEITDRHVLSCERTVTELSPSCERLPDGRLVLAQMGNTPLVIAHRGVHTSGIPENTMAAFDAALAAGADMIELDVRRTADGELAILHDHAVNRVPLDSCSLDEFEARTGFRPPLLEEVLGWADGRIGLDVELKEDGYAEQVAPLLVEFAHGGNELIVTSFIDPLLAQLSELAPQLRLGLLIMWIAERAADRAGECGAQVVLPEMKLVDEALITAVLDAGLQLIVWDFMAEQHAALLSDPRVAAVITDDVPGAIAARVP
jgi:glycerophosphoryl diester phosphodiesterase